MKFFTAYAFAWISVSAAIIVGLYLTKDASCLWGFVFPLCISGSSKTN